MTSSKIRSLQSCIWLLAYKFFKVSEECLVLPQDFPGYPKLSQRLDHASCSNPCPNSGSIALGLVLAL